MRGRTRAAPALVALVALAVPMLDPVVARPDEPLPPVARRLLSAGEYLSPFAQATESTQRVAPFWLDVVPVTKARYLEFVRSHPRWQRSRASKLLTDDAYLSDWRGDLSLGDGASPREPVTFVSWFAASAYCESLGKRLPSEAEWEWAAAAEANEAVADRVIAFFTRPAGQLPEVGSTTANRYGVRDMHGVVWEWVDDFNASIAAHDRWQDADERRKKLCGGASISAEEVGDHASFLRFAFRSEIEANAASHDLGFRCAGDSH